MLLTAGFENDNGDWAGLRTPLTPWVDKESERNFPVPKLTLAVNVLSDCHTEDSCALIPMRLAAEPEDDPSNEPINTTSCEPEGG